MSSQDTPLNRKKDTMNRKDHTTELFKQQLNCAQSVFTAYRQTETMDEESALKLATVFGAGVSATGSSLCGAVTGALMAISMKHGRKDIESVNAKIKTYELGRRFMAEFSKRLGSCDCEKIIGMNIGTPENMRKAQEMNLFATKCLNAVKTAGDILETML